MRTSWLTFLLFVTLCINAQDPFSKRVCGSEIPGKAWDDWFNAKVEEFKNSPAAKNQQTDYVIPIIFHVIHGGEEVGTFPNLSLQQLYSQVEVLNEDFAGEGYNVEKFLTTSFSPTLVANCSISFCLASKDPDGNELPEAGIERMSYQSKSWASPSSFGSIANFKTFIENTVKTATIWDPARYLNIWVSDANPSIGLLGYASFPPGTGMIGVPAAGNTKNDGLWCYGKAVGNQGTLLNNYNKGRTATHEIGHYFGLRHIWGDGSCATDYCNDTPSQQKENTDCPVYPRITCSNGPNGEMFMNFMDYCLDQCMYMFTNDQRTRMQTALQISPLRKELTASSATLCPFGPLGLRKSVVSAGDVQLFPNPSSGNFKLVTGNGLSGKIKEVSVYNSLGERVYQLSVQKQSTGEALEIDATGLAKGIYFVQIDTEKGKVSKKLVIEKNN